MRKHLSALLIPLILMGVSATAQPRRRVVVDYDEPAPPPAPPTVYQASNQFAFDLYGRVAKDQTGNMIFSPASISLAMGMTLGGASGETLKQMGRVLHVERFTTLAEMQEGHAALLAALAAVGKQKGVELRIANQLFGQKGYPFAKAFLDVTKQRYGAKLEQVDFEKKFDKARKQINAWVEKQTKKRIKNLLPDGSLDADARLVLVNAIYFKATWAQQFKKKNTYDGAFMLQSGDTVQTPMMSQGGGFSFGQIDGLSVLELPYRGDAVSMVLFLPDALDGLPALEQQLNLPNVERWMAAMKPEEEVSVTMPRFTASLDLPLSKKLIALGMGLAFDQDKADFSAMIDKKGLAEGERLYIQNVFHKAFISVDEAGAEAAAATGVVMAKPTSVKLTPTFRADHPFFYILRDVKTGTILFMGRVVDPRS